MKILFFLPLVFLVNTAFADDAEIQMDWFIEGQIDKKSVTSQQSEIVSSYEVPEVKDAKPIYDKFITDNQYSIGEYKITIDSEEGQILNGMLIEQRDLRQESFQQKIKYYDRFSDGYVQIAEALLDPIGNSKYLIQGRSLDYNPNSNLDLFVLERGYSMDDLESIPNDIFTPKEFTLGRTLMDEAIRNGEGEFDLREYSPNYLLLNKEQIQEKMLDAFTEQTSQIFNEIMSGEQLESDTVPNIGIATSQPSRSSENMFDNFKFEKPKFENTRHIRDSLQSNSFQVPSPQEFENTLLLLIIPVFVALAVFGYLMHKQLKERKPEEPFLLVSSPQNDFRELTHEMLRKSSNLYENNKQKEAHEVLSQAIRYYYSQNLKIYKEITNFELLSVLRESKSAEFDKVKDWLLLCGSVEYARYESNNEEFKNALSNFSKEVF